MTAPNDHRAVAATIRAAAAALRSQTIADQHAGREHPVRAFHLALTLDELARHARDLPDDVQRATLQACSAILEPGRRGEA